MATLEVGSEFAGYRIEAILARGGMGVVYHATQAQPSRRVALKLIAPEFASDAGYRERFLREADLLASLDDCPSIVPIYASGEADGQLYLAMRFLDGPDLATLLQQGGPLSLARTSDILRPVAEALDAAHEAGLVHRDVKPSNIMFDRRSAVYLMDFGLTKRAGSNSGLTRPDQAIGTAGYMAPEQFLGRPTEPHLAPRIDIYALGCVLHACLTGTEPYPRDTYEQALYAHVYEPPPRLTAQRADIPPEMDAILSKALAKDPRERYERASDLAKAVREQADAPRPAAAAPPPATVISERGDEPVPPPPTRHRIDTPPPTTVPPLPAQTVLAEPPSGPPPILPPPTGPVGGWREPPQPSRNRQIAIVGGVAIAVLLGAGALASMLGGNRDGAPTASPSAQAVVTAAPSPTPTPSPEPTPVVTAPPVTPPTGSAAPGTHTGSDEDMERLIATLDPTIGDTCEKAASYASEALVDVQCDRDGGSIWYTLFPDEASMYDYYNASVSISGIAKDTSSCTGGEVSESVWNFRDEEDIPRGRILCQIADSGSAFLDFTVDETLTIGSMLDLDGDLERLFTIWAEGTVIPIIPS